MSEYLGFKEVTLSDEELALIYQKAPNYNLGCLENEYLVVHNKNGEIADHFRWDGIQFVQVPYKQISSRFCGKVKPRNTQQRLAIDMLYNPEITINMIGGKFGTGKTFIMATAAMELLEKDKFDRLVYVRNNIEVKDSKPIGFIPGDKDEKLLPFAMPLADNIGGPEALKMMISQGNIETVHFGQIRGRDFKNSIIMCSEVENMTKEHIQLLLGRVDEGSALWIDGDVRQRDRAAFEKSKGLETMIDRLKGEELFGYVHLVKSERSATARLADKLN